MPGFVSQDDVNLYNTSTSSGSFLSSIWGGFKGVLEDGISIYSDYMALENQGWHGNYSPYPERYPPTGQGMPADMAAANSQWVPGVSNGVVLIGAAGLIALIALKG